MKRKLQSFKHNMEETAGDLVGDFCLQVSDRVLHVEHCLGGVHEVVLFSCLSRGVVGC